MKKVKSSKLQLLRVSVGSLNSATGGTLQYDQYLEAYEGGGGSGSYEGEVAPAEEYVCDTCRPDANTRVKDCTYRHSRVADSFRGC